jgi:hypothetical protein
MQQGTFARAGCPHTGNALAALHLQIDAVEYHNWAARFAKDLAQRRA